MSATAVPPATRAEKLSWCFFDFANSSFTTVIVTVFFAPYFSSVIAPDPATGDRWWARAIYVSQILVVLSGPLIGVLADSLAHKKRYLASSWITCVLFTGALSLARPGDLWLAWGAFVIANAAYSSGENLVAGFLPELAKPEEIGRLSGLGWSIGYFGGLASLGIALPLVTHGMPQWVPASTAVFFLLAGLPTMILLRERATPHPTSAGELWREAFGTTLSTVRAHRRFPDLFRLLASLFFQQAGISTVIAFAAIFAEREYRMSQNENIQLFIGLQIAAALGAIVFGWIQDRVGSRPSLIYSIFLWLAAIACVAFGTTRPSFYAGAAFAGVAMGSSQSSGRAMVGLFTPAGRSGEWFGLWGLSTKLAAVAGAALYDLLRSVMSIRHAMMFNAVYFVLGLLILLAVNERRGRAAAAAP